MVICSMPTTVILLWPLVDYVPVWVEYSAPFDTDDRDRCAAGAVLVEDVPVLVEHG